MRAVTPAIRTSVLEADQKDTNKAVFLAISCDRKKDIKSAVVFAVASIKRAVFLAIARNISSYVMFSGACEPFGAV